MPLYIHRNQRLLFMRFSDGKILASMPGHGRSDGTLENSDFVRLSASDFPCGRRAVLSLVKDPGIIGLQLSKPMGELAPRRKNGGR